MMADQVKVTPAEGRRVRDEQGAVLPPKGKSVLLSSYWRRKEVDGDVTLAPLGKQARAPKKSAAKES